MFAVPGWSVSAKNLKVEKRLPEPSSKKRKRPSQDDQTVDADRIDELWNKHVKNHAADGDQLQKAQKQKKRSIQGTESSSRASEQASVLAAKELSDRVEAIQTNGKAREHRTNEKSKGNQQELAKKHAKPIDEQNSTTMKSAKRKRKKSTGNDEEHQAGDLSSPVPRTGASVQLAAPELPTLTPLQAKMRQKLVSSRFRHLNETLYTNPSDYSLELFKTNPVFFAEYHEGFRKQVEAWPEDPKESFLRWLKERGPVGMHNYKAIRRKTSRKSANNGQTNDADTPSGPESLPRDPHKGICTIADLGCGDGKLGSDVLHSSLQKKLKLKVLSYDLAASAPHITVADMKSLPLEDSSVDIAIFCLALMGTNWIEFVEEAYRVLRWKGECWIAEVASRFGQPKSKRVEHSVGNKVKDKQKSKGKQNRSKQEDDDELGLLDDGDETPQKSTDVSSFVDVLHRRGFQLQGKPYTGNKMFVLMRFVKALPPRRGKCVKQDRREGKKKFIEEDDVDVTVEEEGRVLKPCVYKLR